MEPDSPDAPMVVAHHPGGASSHDNAEHTLGAYVAALDAGAEGLECDVRLTADGHLVCVHDRDLRRTAGSRGVGLDDGPRRARASSTSPSWKNPWADLDDEAPDRDEELDRVLTLRKLLETVADYDRRVEVAIETKHPTRYGGLVEKRLVEMLRDFGWDRGGSPVRVMSFSFTALQRVEPDGARGAAGDADRQARRLADAAPDDRQGLAGRPGHRAAARAPEARPGGSPRRGRDVHVWTVNTEEDLELCLDARGEGGDHRPAGVPAATCSTAPPVTTTGR